MPFRMLRLSALAALVATIALVSTGTVAGARQAPAGPTARAGLISAIKSKVCDFLDGVESVELPISLGHFVASGELEASTVILFGANKALCGGGRVEKVFSLAHDWLLGAVTHNLNLSGFNFGSLKLKLPSVVNRLAGLPTLGVRDVAYPTATFSGGRVGSNNLMPLTINWLAAPLVSRVFLEAVPLSSSTAPFTWHLTQATTGSGLLVGTQSFPLALSSGRWQLCIRPDTVFKSRNDCGYPFWINVDSGQAASLNFGLFGSSHRARVGVYGSQIGVEVSSARGNAYFKVDPLCANVFVCFREAGFAHYDSLGFPQRFFAYWAWNLGEACHSLQVAAPSIGTPAVAGHIVAVVSIASLPLPRC